MNDYYNRLEHLRDLLDDQGWPELARELLIAERSASTSGEAINNTGVLLRQILDSTEVTDTALRAELTQTLTLGRSLWDRSNHDG